MARLSKQFESNTNEWETPESIYLPLHTEFKFTLDAAATSQNAKCAKYFDKDSNGLIQEWDGVVWLNPPYGRGLDKWMQKCVKEQQRGVTTVCLIPARTNTNWFHDFCLKHGEVRFVRGRPKFGNADQGLPWPLVIVVFKSA